MNLSSLSQIEKKVIRLPPGEQLWLAERIIHRLRKQSSNDRHLLAAMAADEEIQTELQKIEEEFAITESDGLEEE